MVVIENCNYLLVIAPNLLTIVCTYMNICEMCIFDNVWNYGKVSTNLYLYVTYVKLRVNHGVVNDPKKSEYD